MLPPPRHKARTLCSAALIWFEIWRVVEPGQNNFDFYKRISEKFRVCQAILPKKFDWPFTATSGQITLFLFKSHHFRKYFLYMIRYSNISQPVHNPLRPSTTLQLKIWGSRSPRIDALVSVKVRHTFKLKNNN